METAKALKEFSKKISRKDDFMTEYIIEEILKWLTQRVALSNKQLFIRSTLNLTTDFLGFDNEGRFINEEDSFGP